MRKKLVDRHEVHRVVGREVHAEDVGQPRVSGDAFPMVGGVAVEQRAASVETSVLALDAHERRPSEVDDQVERLNSARRAEGPRGPV